MHVLPLLLLAVTLVVASATGAAAGDPPRVVQGSDGDSPDGTVVHQLAPLFEDVTSLWPDDDDDVVRAMARLPRRAS